MDDVSDKLIKFCKENSSSKEVVTLDQVKNLYIGSGLSAEEIAAQTVLSLEKVKSVIEKYRLDELRAIAIRQGLEAIKNAQLQQAEKLLTLENQFKRLRIIQLQKQLEDYAAYYARYGHFNKVHPVSGEILKDTDGIPMQIHLPNIGKELTSLKESVSLSEGLKNILSQIDDIIRTPSKSEDDVLEADFSVLFEKSK